MYKPTQWRRSMLTARHTSHSARGKLADSKLVSATHPLKFVWPPIHRSMSEAKDIFFSLSLSFLPLPSLIKVLNPHCVVVDANVRRITHQCNDLQIMFKLAPQVEVEAQRPTVI